MDNPDAGNALTLAIAGYGTGKSHLAVALSVLLSGEQWQPELHETVLQNIARADENIEKQIRPLVKKPRLVLTLNGMRDFNLHYELLRTAEKALKLYDADLDVLAKLNKVKETATVFIERSYDLLEEHFVTAARKHGVFLEGNSLKEYLLQLLNNEIGVEFDIINTVYEEFNGHPIRMDEGVSASMVLDTLLRECCGLHGQFDGIVILFDEFGRFLEYVSANPAAAGDSALQQIFESVQNADGDIQFVGFIQSDIKSYLQRVDKSSNISRYIDRYDAGEKVYLSSNLETIFANLLDKKDRLAFNREIVTRLNENEKQYQSLFVNLQKWLPLKGIWNQWADFRRIILEEIYPLHPISTYLLCNLTDWLQSRSSLTLLSEKVKLLGNQTIVPDQQLPLIYPVELLKGAFFDELLNAEEQGRQRSQFCILLNSIYRKFDTKLTDDARSVLLANLILRICRFKFDSREELISAIQECSGLKLAAVSSAIALLETEYAVLSYDDRLVCFDFVADSVGANEFRNFLKTAQNRITFRADMLNQNDIQEFADVLKPIETDFGAKHGIQTREWSFVQQIDHIQNIVSTTVGNAYKELQGHTLPNTERGMLLWLYIPKETANDKLDLIIQSLQSVNNTQAFVVMALDDSDNSLQEAIVSYRVLADMREDDKVRYQRFYADAFEKAKEKVSLLFADLKQQRKVITAEGVVSEPKRLKIYLASVFESVYPKAIPFDFEGFDAKGTNGAAYKNFCTIMKWILMDGMNYVALKSQSSDVKNRVDSLIGPHGLFSWKALSSEYKSIAPINGNVSKLYNSLETILNTKKLLSFKQIAAQLTASPYGMNEYAAFMFLSLFSELFAYTTRLELNGARYSTHSWAEEVLQDKKFDVKLFNKTKLLLVDVGETINRYRYIYNRIKKNTDFAKVSDLRQELEQLKQEESVPEQLEAEDDLASMLLSEGDKARRSYEERIAKIDSDIRIAKRSLNPYSALTAALDVQKLSFESYANGRYVYSASQTEEMDSYVVSAKQIASQAFEDGWIRRYNCIDPEKLGSYKSFASRAGDLFNKYGFVKEAIELSEIVGKEVARIQLIIEQEAFVNSCERYLISSQIRTGITQKNLSAFLEQGSEMVKGFDRFDYEADKQFVDLRTKMISRIQDLNNALADFKEQLDGIWNAIYDISCLDDIRHVHARIESVLSSGLTDRDREDFEGIDHELNRFLSDMTELVKKIDNRNDLQNACVKAKEDYSEFEVDVSDVIDGICKEMLDDFDSKERYWVNKYLEINPEDMTQAELDLWKRNTQPIPGFVSSETEGKYRIVLQKVENELTKQRVNYIVMLYKQLSDVEKEKLIQIISHE